MLEYLAVATVWAFQAAAVIIWGVRQEGKITLQDQKIVDLKELINTRFDSTDTRLERMERALNGSLHHDGSR